MFDTMHHAVDAPIATIRLNRPDRLNALAHSRRQTDSKAVVDPALQARRPGFSCLVRTGATIEVST